METLEEKLLGFIESDGLLAVSGKVLLAVSGGADSTALLHAMAALKQAGNFKPEICCIHVNHQLRNADSDGDQDFIVGQAKKLNIAITTKTVDVRALAKENKLSIETAARELRMKALLDTAKKDGINFIVTAHHADDNTETIIQRLSRGTGFRGLAGIWPMREFAEGFYFVRPMLEVSRQEIIDYLKKKNLKWREDKSNLDCYHRRNFIRHKLLPAIQNGCDGQIVTQLCQLATAARKLQIKIEQQTEKIWQQIAKIEPDSITLDMKLFENQQPLVKIELIRKSLVALGSGERDLSQVHYESVLRLTDQKVSGKKVDLPGNFCATFEYGKLIFSKTDKFSQESKPAVEIELTIPGKVWRDGYLIEAEVLDAEQVDIARFKADKDSFTEWFDLNKLKLPLVLRPGKEGEVFVPLGQCGTKKIARFLIDGKVPGRIRRQSMVIADKGKIIWVWPLRISELAKKEAGTRKILQLRITGPNF